jgi:Ala-tRNA(Pro) deacylase
MLTSEKDLLEFLDDHHFPYLYRAHEAVFTCAEAEKKRPHLPGVSTKNLFLCDGKGKLFFLAVTACEKQLDLEALGSHIGARRLRFGSEANLSRLLGVTRGAVTVLGLLNDTERAVELWMDRQVWESTQFLCHPLVNTATLVLSKETLEAFINLTGHTIHLFDSP